MEKLILVILLSLFSSSTFSITVAECNSINFREIDNFTKSECAYTLRLNYEKQLNILLKKIKKSKSIDPLFKQSVVSTQQLFKDYMNEQCLYYLKSAEGSADGSGVISQAFCEAEFLKQRIDLLKRSI